MTTDLHPKVLYKAEEKQEEKTYNEVAHDVLEGELTKRAEICKCGHDKSWHFVGRDGEMKCRFPHPKCLCKKFEPKKSKLFPSREIKGMLTDGQGAYYPDEKPAGTSLNEQIIKEVLEEVKDKTINGDFKSFDEQFIWIIKKALILQDKKIFPKKKGYIIFDEDQYFKRKKEIEEDELAERNKEIGKEIDDELSLKRKKEDKLILEYHPISHISNSKTQALQREMKEIKIEIKLLEELKQKLGVSNGG